VNIASATVLICTYNRARLLRDTLGALRTMNPPRNYDAEIVIVDNNSSDETRAVVAEAARVSPIPILLIGEKRQGKSFALNRGLSVARGDVLALTDDDVWPADDWLNRIVADFRAHSTTFVFGKVLPRWQGVPPPELLIPRAQDVWGPLAIVDYGDEPASYVAASTRQRLPIGANLAFLKSALVRIGGWRTDLGKVDNTLISGEDHEIFMRLRRHDLYSGHYDPELTVRHLVPAARLTRRYFRRWFFWHGKTQALMLNDLFPDVDMARVPRIAGVPRFLYRQAVAQIRKYLTTLRHGDAFEVMVEELRALQFAGMFAECWRQALRSTGRPPGERAASDATVPPQVMVP
jgi:glycosyltransferase involved in cell wall biosynthesis